MARIATRPAMSFELILPFLRPIAHLIQDPHITEVMVNGSGRVFVEREGHLESTDVSVREHNLRVAVRLRAGRRRVEFSAPNQINSLLRVRRKAFARSRL